jgi:hypothetical protein
MGRFAALKNYLNLHILATIQKKAFSRDRQHSSTDQLLVIFKNSKLSFSPAAIDPKSSVDPIPPLEFHLVLKVIASEFRKALRGYESRTCAGNQTGIGCHMISLSKRYAIDAGVDSIDEPRNVRNFEFTRFLIFFSFEKDFTKIGCF